MRVNARVRGVGDRRAREVERVPGAVDDHLDDRRVGQLVRVLELAREGRELDALVLEARDEGGQVGGGELGLVALDVHDHVEGALAAGEQGGQRLVRAVRAALVVGARRQPLEAAGRAGRADLVGVGRDDDAREGPRGGDVRRRVHHQRAPRLVEEHLPRQPRRAEARRDDGHRAEHPGAVPGLRGGGGDHRFSRWPAPELRKMPMPLAFVTAWACGVTL